MEATTPSFSAADKHLLTAIRENVRARPTFFGEGIEYLAGRYSRTKLYGADMRAWAEEREFCDREVSDSNKPVEHTYDIYRSLSMALQELRQTRLSTPDDSFEATDTAKAKAVICLTWLLTDKDANMYSLGCAYGPWLDGQLKYEPRSAGEEFHLEHAARGRAQARRLILDEFADRPVRRDWMELTREAAQALGIEIPIAGSAAPASKGSSTKKDAEAEAAHRARTAAVSLGRLIDIVTNQILESGGRVIWQTEMNAPNGLDADDINVLARDAGLQGPLIEASYSLVGPEIEAVGMVDETAIVCTLRFRHPDGTGKAFDVEWDICSIRAMPRELSPSKVMRTAENLRAWKVRLPAPLLDIPKVTETPSVPLRVSRAASQLDEAVKDSGNETMTDDQAYEYYCDHLADGHDDMPNCETWKRQVRAWRKMTNTQKNQRRDVPSAKLARSVISASELPRATRSSD